MYITRRGPHWFLVMACIIGAVQTSCASDQREQGAGNPSQGAGAGGAYQPTDPYAYAGSGGQPVAGSGSAALAGSGGAGAGGAGSASVVEPGTCGNGLIDPGEQCDPAAVITDTCESLALGAGSLVCDDACAFDTTGCSSAAADLFTVNHELSPVIGTVGIVTWSTRLSALSEAYIEFGLDTGYGMRAPVDLNEPDFRTLLLGMKGSRDYHFRVVANSGGTEYKSDDYLLTTGPVTNLVRVDQLNVDNEAARARGFITSSLFQAMGGGGGFFPPFGGSGGALAFIADADGDIVWWYSPSLSTATRARMSYDGKHMWMVTVGMEMGGSSGVERVSMDGLDAQSFITPATHDITPATGNVMAFPAGGFNGCVVITEVTPDGTMTPVFDTNQIWANDACHANAIRYSEAENVYTLSDLTQGDIIMVDRATGTVTSRLSDFSFDWGSHQHGHHLLSDSIVIFNNGHRIAQEISLDRGTLQSSEIWRYSSAFSSEVLGDVQRLPNGNTLVTYSTAGAVHEVDASGNRVMEMRFSQSSGYALWRGSLYGLPPDVTL